MAPPPKRKDERVGKKPPPQIRYLNESNLQGLAKTVVRTLTPRRSVAPPLASVEEIEAAAAAQDLKQEDASFVAEALRYRGLYFATIGMEIKQDRIFHRIAAPKLVPPPDPPIRSFEEVTVANFQGQGVSRYFSPATAVAVQARSYKIPKIMLHCTAGAGSMWPKTRSYWISRYKNAGSGGMFPTHFVIDQTGLIVQVLDVAQSPQHTKTPDDSTGKFAGMINNSSIGIELIIPEASNFVPPNTPRRDTAETFAAKYYATLTQDGYLPSYAAVVKVQGSITGESAVGKANAADITRASAALSRAPSAAQVSSLRKLMAHLSVMFDIPLTSWREPQRMDKQLGLTGDKLFLTNTHGTGASVSGMSDFWLTKLREERAYMFYRAGDAATAIAMYRDPSASVFMHMQIDTNRMDPFGLDLAKLLDGAKAEKERLSSGEVYLPWQIYHPLAVTQT